LGKGQYEIFRNRKPIAEILENQEIDVAIRKKLELVNIVRDFAVRDLALNPEGGYVYYAPLDRQEVGWHVTASYPLKFESYTWWFPIVGSVPYKGYFDLEKAKEEELSLKKKGMDTKLRITAGYSTLGWFSDPLLSPQMRLKEPELVALVIHEMSHATIYFSDDSLFNESYASFVENEGTNKYYLQLQTSESLKILEDRKISKQENAIVFKEIRNTAEELKVLYDSKIPDSEKILKKRIILENFRGKILELGKSFRFFNQKKWEEMELNNENFIGALRYQSGDAFFQRKFQEVSGNFKKFHLEMQKLKSMSKEERKKILEE
jgi:predicted aminopeptidase